jgi:hypothetical protein
MMSKAQRRGWSRGSGHDEGAWSPGERARALTGSAGDGYRPVTVQAHHFFFMDPA